MRGQHHPYVVFRGRGDFWTAYVHVKVGEGRSARRTLVGTFHIPLSDYDADGPQLLRALAYQMELPPSDRWTPAL
jgi:hypothetical protein